MADKDEQTVVHDDLERLICDELTADPQFADDLREAEALLRLAHETAARRTEQGLTQRDLARLLHVSAALVGRFEQAGRAPNVLTLWKVADALGVRFVIEPGFGVRVEPARRTSDAERPPVSDRRRPAARRSHAATGA